MPACRSNLKRVAGRGGLFATKVTNPFGPLARLALDAERRCGAAARVDQGIAELQHGALIGRR